MGMIVVLFPILTLFWMLHQDDMYMMNRIDTTIREQSARTDKLHEEFHKSIEELQKSITDQSLRSDRLYEMFIDLLNKDKK